ncbi:SCY1-like protein 2 [Anabrus simplex]|uniref:SCY1-like protein 2 n=1 Tax=Anabrus simplex TaxID=316456 RepID=UPI0035A38D9D
MDVINKLYSTVSSTVSQLSGVLPGNPVTREFEAICHIASAGPGLLWKIYRGYKKSTKQEAAIFVLEKRQLERWSRTDREAMLDTLRRGVSQLTRLRHPQVLTVQHPLEESRESLAFATEPVFASLANILGATENMPSPPPNHLKNYRLFEVEIKYGLVQIGEGLAFLHSDVKLLHRNIGPESIVVNQQGAWKIFGFDFCVLNQNAQDIQPYWPFSEYVIGLQPLAQPNLDYMAPECALTLTHSPASDMFSLGMLILAVYNAGQPLNNNGGDWNSYKRNCIELKQLSMNRLECIADGLREFVKMLLNITPELRPDAHQFTKIPFFEDVGVKTLNYLDSLFQWDNLQKSQFYKGLPQIIQNLPHRVCIYRILPCLVKEFVNPSMVPFVLPNVLLIAENCSKEEFYQHILPHLKPVMKMQDPIQILLIFMQKMELLLKLTPPEEIKTDVLPMLYRALEADAQQIQELCLSVLPTFAGLVDYPSMKNALLPRIKRLCIATSYISVRVNCLVCVGKLLEHLDKWLVLDEVLPFLPQVPSREPAVLMGILGIYKLALTHKKLGITKELMATKILPFLMPLSIENGLTLNQFNALMAVIKEMVNRVEGEHRTKLEQLNSIQQEQKSTTASLSSGTKGMPLVPAPAPSSEMDDMFAGLGLESFTGSNLRNGTSDVENLNVQKNTPQVNGSTTSLSLLDKQRLAKEQETQQRLQSQPALNPTPPAQSKTPPQVKDLTATLMESNLNQMKYTRPAAPASEWQVPPASPFTAVVQPQSQAFGAFQSAPANQSIQWPAPQPMFRPPVQQINPFPVVSPRMPMSMLPLTQTPLLQQQKAAKPLSASEINDLLS